MAKTIFSDGVADVVIVGGVVRVDFFALVRDPTISQSPQSANEPPPMQRKTEVTVAIPIPAFLASCNVLEEVRKALMKETANQESEAPALRNLSRKSPNFDS